MLELTLNLVSVYKTQHLDTGLPSKKKKKNLGLGKVEREFFAMLSPYLTSDSECVSCLTLTIVCNLCKLTAI